MSWRLGGLGMIAALTLLGQPSQFQGSAADGIARTVAEHLGWKLWDPLLTTEIARHLECYKLHVERHEETRDPLYYRLFKAFLRGSFDGGINAHRMKLADAETIRCVAEKLVRQAAEKGNCVVVGRGSAYYLHGSPEAFNAFAYAPFGKEFTVCNRRATAKRNRFISRRPLTRTARPSSSSISTLSGRHARTFT